MGLLGDFLRSVHDARPGHVRYPYQPSEQLPALWPFEFILELIPGPEISGCGRGVVELRRNIEAFHYVLDTRLPVDFQDSLLPDRDKRAPTVVQVFAQKVRLEELIEVFPEGIHIRVPSCNHEILYMTGEIHLNIASITGV